MLEGVEFEALEKLADFYGLGTVAPLLSLKKVVPVTGLEPVT